MLREETDAHTHSVEIIRHFLIRCLFWKNTDFTLLFYSLVAPADRFKLIVLM